MKKVNFDYFFPKDFFKKEINEKFQLFLLNNCIGPFVDEEITRGNADLKQPDLILRDIPVELTLASTEEETTTYIKDIKDHTLQTLSLIHIFNLWNAEITGVLPSGSHNFTAVLKSCLLYTSRCV